MNSLFRYEKKISHKARFIACEQNRNEKARDYFVLLRKNNVGRDKSFYGNIMTRFSYEIVLQNFATFFQPKD